MIKAILIACLFPFCALAQEGTVCDTLSVHSALLNMDRKYAVYLPPGYQHSQRSYPVLYLLHGGGVDHTGWLQQGEIQSIADKAIKEGSASAMIIVMPDAYTQRRGYYQNKENWLYEDFFFQEFIPHIEQAYRIRREKHFRAIAGYSIGGKAAFTYTLHHPEMFASSCPISAATNAANQEGSAEKKQQTASWYKENNVITLVQHMPDSLKKTVRWYIDCGDDDTLYESNALVRIAMLKAGINNEFRVRDGGHNWVYWRGAMPAVLEFISAGFRDY